MRTWLKKIAWFILGLIFVCFIIGLVFIVYIEAELPDVNTLKNVQLQVPLRIYSADNKLIAEYGVERRNPVTLEQIPKKLINATLATEDERYYSHGGVDFWGLGRAALVLITTGHKAQGGSTITMQVARNYFLTRKKTYMRKIREILLAFKIDHNLSKNDVLILYFNKIFYGNRAYGVAAASHTYYGEKLNQLTLPQIAMIAGLPKAPSTLNPLYNPDAALSRRNHVLTRMHDRHFITDSEYQQAMHTPITASYHGPKIEVNAPYVASMIQQAMEQKYGQDIYDKGLDVYTTINSQDQQAANQSIFNGVLNYDRRHGYRGTSKSLGSSVPNDLTDWQNSLQKANPINGLLTAAIIGLNDKNATALLSNGQIMKISWSGLSWARKQYFKNGQEYLANKPTQASDILKIGDVVRVYKQKHWWLAQFPQVEAAIVALNPHNGAIKALVGGFNYNKSKFNRITQAYRQPGSSFKPFIYSAALAKGYTLSSMINDAPVVLENNDQFWRPQNDTRKFYGMTSLENALMQSRNLVSIRLLSLIGIPYAINYSTRFGFKPEELPKSLSLALGTASVTPLQMAKGYAVFANGGYRVTPHLINKVNADGNTIYQANLPLACDACIANPKAAPPNSTAPQVITPQNAYLMTIAMKAVIQSESGTGTPAKALKRHDLAGKTGTTNDKRDAWFSGYNNDIVSTAWMGFDTPRSLYEFGNQAALPIWIDFMRNALKGTPIANMPEPTGLVSVRINPKTGMLASPGEDDASFAIFRQQYAPTQTSANTSSSHTDRVKETLEQQIY